MLTGIFAYLNVDWRICLFECGLAAYLFAVEVDSQLDQKLRLLRVLERHFDPLNSFLFDSSIKWSPFKPSDLADAARGQTGWHLEASWLRCFHPQTGFLFQFLLCCFPPLFSSTDRCRLQNSIFGIQNSSTYIQSGSVSRFLLLFSSRNGRRKK